jgi:hypothetical protein
MATEACLQASEACPEAQVFTWAATLVFLLVVLVAIVAFWYWWSKPNRTDSDHSVYPTDKLLSEEEYVDSRERLDLLRAARRWGDISTTDAAYLRRRRQN